MKSSDQLDPLTKLIGIHIHDCRTPLKALEMTIIIFNELLASLESDSVSENTKRIMNQSRVGLAYGLKSICNDAQDNIAMLNSELDTLWVNTTSYANAVQNRV